MDRRSDKTEHVIVLGDFEKKKKYKEQIVQEIIAAICAMLNSNGGKLAIDIKTDSYELPVGGSLFSLMSSVIRILEQSIISVIGQIHTISNINFQQDKKGLLIFVEKTDSLITTNYNLYLPSQTQVVQVSPWEPKEKVKDNVINRKMVPEPVQIGSHCKIFSKGTICDLSESKTVQLKHLEAHPTKRTTLADRMIGKGNKLMFYVAAYSNHIGGHMYFGITDEGVVVGEVILNEEGKREITKKVEKTIKKLIWPEHFGKPIRRKHWDIFFEPVVDEDNKPIPSTFVIVIYIAPCLGGVFTEEPECYEMAEGKVRKMSFFTWRERMLLPGWSCSGEEIPPSIQRITWSSAVARESFTFGGEKLRTLISNGHWDATLKTCEVLCKNPQSCEMLLLILSKKITAFNRRGQFKKAHDLLEEYERILPQAKDRFIFEVLKLYLGAALERATGDLRALKELLSAALSMAEQIEPGLVTAIVYVFAATVTDLVYSEDLEKKFSPGFLSRRALEHLRYVSDSCEVRSDMEQKAYMILASFHLGYNINGQRIKDNINISDLEKAKGSVTAINQRADEASCRTKYHDVQFNLVLSIYKFRKSQFSPNERVRFLRNAYDHAEKAGRIANDSQFTEMFEWSKAVKAFCTEQLLRAKLEKD